MKSTVDRIVQPVSISLKSRLTASASVPLMWQVRKKRSEMLLTQCRAGDCIVAWNNCLTRELGKLTICCRQNEPEKD